nr:hypothetical protein [Clostridioides sp.]
MQGDFKHNKRASNIKLNGGAIAGVGFNVVNLKRRFNYGVRSREEG